MLKKRLLGVFAHPDDEGVIGGALLHYSMFGVETGLICATRGEVGEIADPALATPENLGQVREGEMQAAAEVLGIHSLWFLDYRDSGMAGTPENEDPRSLAQASALDVVSKLVAIIRQFRPQVMVTFDETGGYGHPDHIAIYKHTTSAFHAAVRGEAWVTRPAGDARTGLVVRRGSLLNEIAAPSPRGEGSASSMVGTQDQGPSSQSGSKREAPV